MMKTLSKASQSKRFPNYHYELSPIKRAFAKGSKAEDLFWPYSGYIVTVTPTNFAKIKIAFEKAIQIV